jgi:hypothetical protein
MAAEGSRKRGPRREIRSGAPIHPLLQPTTQKLPRQKDPSLLSVSQISSHNRRGPEETL